VAPLPAREPAVHLAGREPGAPGAGRGLKAAAAALALAVAEALLARVAGVGAVPAVLRTALAALVLFGVAGYAPAVALLPAAWREQRALFVLPLGAACAALELALLGLLRVPMPAALAVVLAAGGAAGLVAARREGTGRRRPRPTLRAGLPLLVAVLVAAIALLPVFRSGYATVHGQNGDAVLAVGVAVLLEHAPPTAVREDLPLDRMPVVWRSKVPIYSALAGVSDLAGQDPIVAFSTVAALLYALFSLGLFLLARCGLGAGVVTSAAVAMLVPLTRISVYVAIHPYYNQTWGLFALPFVLLFGWWALRHPGPRAVALLAIFLALALFAYPLLLPFPAVFLGVVAWRRRHARWWAHLGVPGPRRRPGLWLATAVFAIPFVAVLFRGVAEKVGSAVGVLAPWSDLSGWSGTALPYLPVGWFAGMGAPAPVAAALALGVLGAAFLGLRAVRAPELRAGLAATVVAGILIGAYFYARGEGQLFYFKALAFTAPLTGALAVVGLASVRRRVLGGAALALLALVVANGARQEIDQTYDHASRPVLELRRWDATLPRGASVRIDVPPTGLQLWSWYMLASRPVSALTPLGGFFPHPPAGTKGDLVLALTSQPRPRGAVGGAVRRNAQFVLYRLDPRLPGRDTSSRRLVYDQSRITY
jgi:hypothetical protein